MIVTFNIILILLIISVSTIIPAILSKNRSRITWWDYVYPASGVLLWFILQMGDLGGEISKFNIIIELFIILLISVTIPWLRFAFTFINNRLLHLLSFSITFAPVIVALLIRLTMPLLPEK